MLIWFFLTLEQDEQALLEVCKEAYVPKPCEDSESYCEGLEEFCNYSNIEKACKKTCGKC